MQMPCPQDWYLNPLKQWQRDYKDGDNILAAMKVDDRVLAGHLWAEVTVWGPGGRDLVPCHCYKVRLIRPNWTPDEAVVWTNRHMVLGVQEMGLPLSLIA